MSASLLFTSPDNGRTITLRLPDYCHYGTSIDTRHEQGRITIRYEGDNLRIDYMPPPNAPFNYFVCGRYIAIRYFVIHTVVPGTRFTLVELGTFGDYRVFRVTCTLAAG